jgi:transposase InsO family protein
MASTSIVSQIPKLKGASNFDAWYNGLKGVAKVNGAWKILTGADPKPTDEKSTTYGQDLKEWEQVQEKMDGIIRLSVEAGPLSHIMALEDATSMLKKLEEQYKVRGYTARDIVWRKLTRSELSDYKTVAEYGEAIKKAKTELAEMGCEIPAWMITTSFLHGLGEAYEEFVTMILTVRTKDDKGQLQEPELDYVMELLKDKERRHAENDNPTKALKSGGKGDNRREKKHSEASNKESCDYCNSLKHQEGKCWFKHPEQARSGWLEKNKEKVEKLRQKTTTEKSQALIVRAAKATASEKDNAWYIDSAASIHLTHDVSWYGDNRLRETTMPVAIADGTNVQASGVGTATLNLLVNGEVIRTDLHNVYYCPELDSNLISLGTLEKNGCSFAGSKGGLRVFNPNSETALEADRVGTLYVAKLASEDRKGRTKGMRANKAATMNLWHQRLAHLNEKDIVRLLEQAEGITISQNDRTTTCEACILGKQHETPSYQPQENRATKRGQRIHADLGGGKASLSNGGNRYFILLTDDYSRMRWVWPLREKKQAASKVKELFAMLRNQGHTVEYFHSDDGGEFRALVPYFKEHGIQWEPAAPYASQQNGVAERGNRIILEKGRAMLIHARLSKSHWAEALNTAVYLTNRTPTSSLPEHKTPYEVWHERKPDIHHLRVFGCTAWVLNYKSKGKMDPRGWKGIFMGYGNGKNQYRVWDGRTVLIRRDVIFEETIGPSTQPIDQEEYTSLLTLWEPEIFSTEISTGQDRRNTVQPPEPAGHAQMQTQNDGTESDDDGSTIVVNTEPTGPPEPPQPMPSRRSERSQGRLDYAQLHREGFARAAHAKPLDGEDPLSYEEAIASHNRDHWQRAMDEELNSHSENKSWNLVPRPDNHKVLGGRWVYKTKLGLDGKVARYKARWVVRGFEQIEGINYNETYAAVVKPATCKILFALAAVKNLKIEQMDVVTAFLYGPIKEEVYVEVPHGTDSKNQVCLLNKALYGLKQAPRVWYETLTEFLTAHGFTRSKYDYGLYYNKTDEIYITIYVDDLKIVGADDTLISNVKKLLSGRFRMKDLGPATHYLGMEIVRTDTTITLRQTSYIDQVLKRYGMENCKPVSTPIDPNVRLGKADDEYVPSKEDVTAFQSMLGSIMYVMCQSRPDIAFGVSKVSQYAARPDNSHWTALKRILRYLSGTKEYGIVYGGQAFVLTGWTDSDWAGDLDDSRSTAGYVFLLAGGAISWASRKQPSVALSTTEAEYMAQKNAATEGIWLRGLLEELTLRDNAPTTIWADNQGAIKLAKNPEFHRRTKHIGIQYHFTRECVENGEIKLVYVPSEEMIADGLTKGLPKARFDQFVNLLGLQKANGNGP